MKFKKFIASKIKDAQVIRLTVALLTQKSKRANNVHTETGEYCPKLFN